jgi:hypothetical protein
VTVNGRIHPHGLPTHYHFEYGPTTAYGSKTAAVPLPPRLGAYYRESWDVNTGGWYGGLRGQGLAHHARGGAAGGFVRYSEPDLHDHNHDHGIGTVHLAKYMYPGPWGKVVNKPSLFLAGGDPDLRDARVSVHVRGNNWVANGTELMWWTQSQKNIKVLNGEGWHIANWAYTGFSLADRLRSGKWEKATYRLWNDARRWTYAGGERGYRYWPINDAQGHVNVDLFHMVTYVDPKNPPRGSIDFDEFELTYRNYSLLLPSNGGKLLRSPRSADDPATLTDGWRYGKNRMWRSAANPTGPLEFIYAFRDPVTIRTVQLHQNPDWPAREVEVLHSVDGKSYASLLKKVLLEKGVPNANFAFTLDGGLAARARFIKVRVTSGYKKQHWGLGEIEVFGSGATMFPDDDLYYVNLDLTKLKPGGTYHYRLVARNRAGTTYGKDERFTVPADQKPDVVTGAASRVTAATARLEGRLNPLGPKTDYYFECGRDARYGMKTPRTYGGRENTPRTVFGRLTGLRGGTTYHYRLVAVNAKGTRYGGDARCKTRGE